MTAPLCFDKKWSLSLPVESAFVPVSSESIRFDSCFTRQLYFKSFIPTGRDKVLATVAQTTASDDGQSVTRHPIFNKVIPVSDNRFTRMCIDEVARKLYFIFPGVEVDTGKCRLGQKFFHLAVFDISFGQPDSFGYRGVSVDEGSPTMYRIRLDQFMVISKMSLFLWPNPPNAGALLCKFRFYFGSFEGPHRHREDCFNTGKGLWFSEVIGVLDWNNAHENTIEIGTVVSPPQSDYLKLSICTLTGHTLLRQGTLWAFFNEPADHHHLPRTDKNAAAVLLYKIDQQALFGKDGKSLEKGIELHFDELELADELLPPAELRSCLPATYRQAFSRMPRFMGRVFKYTLFRLPAGLAVVKRFEQWKGVRRYDPGTKEYLPQTDSRHTFLHFGTPGLFQAAPISTDTIANLNIFGSTLYYEVLSCVMVMKNKKKKNTKQRNVHRLELGIYLKDYRICAGCGVSETSKRRNAQGRRIADFKVCRQCKTLGLHQTWWKYACHFCSDKCMRNEWKDHKKLHDIHSKKN